MAASLYSIYEQATRLARPVLEQLLKRRLAHGKEDGGRLQERMGTPSLPRPAGTLIWVHAASVGEAQSALILIEAIGKDHPGASVLVTTGTLTSAALMQKRLPSFAFHQFIPLDHPAWTNLFLDHWKPDLVLWMESELWPNMLMGVKARKIPAALINARLSDKSFAGWRAARGLAKDILSAFSLILAQTNTDEARYRALCEAREKVILSDNIKYSAAPLPYDEEALQALRLAVGKRPLWVYASTHAGEEALACRVHTALKEGIPDLLTIIVPRHPERREEIAKTCFENSVKFRLRSQHVALPSPDDDLYIADTLGELGLFYTLSPIAMIGRSFSDDGGGGHNPVEAAQLGCAVLTGPNNQFQKQLYGDMRSASAVVELKDETEFCAVLKELLTEQHTRDSLHRRSAAFAAQKAHVIEDVMKALAPLLSATEKRNAA